MPSLCFACAMLQGTVSPTGKLYMHLVPVFVVDSQGTLLDHLPLVAGRVCVPWSHGTVTTGGTVLGRLLSPGHCTVD